MKAKFALNNNPLSERYILSPPFISLGMSLILPALPDLACITMMCMAYYPHVVNHSALVTLSFMKYVVLTFPADEREGTGQSIPENKEERRYPEYEGTSIRTFGSSFKHNRHRLTLLLWMVGHDRLSIALSSSTH